MYPLSFLYSVFCRKSTGKPFTLLLLCGLCCLVFVTAGNAEIDDQNTDNLADWSLEDLINVEVISVSKKPEQVSDAAAAISVITQEDIRRSGATSIPDALRLATGLQVSQISASKWAISSRGFADLFSRNMLVLVDGRSLYTPMFSGVYWDAQHLPLVDIERIEIIRGPGATMWGANAVNGVINIITTASSETQGLLLSGAAGAELPGTGLVRWGGTLGEQFTYRVYGKYFTRERSVNTTGEEANDDWDFGRVGIRMDRIGKSGSRLMINGDLYQGEVGEEYSSPKFNPTEGMDPLDPAAYEQMEKSTSDIYGGSLQAQLQFASFGGSESEIKCYFDRFYHQVSFSGELRHTADLDFQNRIELQTDHDLIWGVGYRFTSDEVDSSFTISLDPDSRSTHLYSAFIQDNLGLSRNRVQISLGSKFEHNDYSGAEIQPSLRLMWKPQTPHSIWGSVSRAVRTMSRGESAFRMNYKIAPAVPDPTHPEQIMPVLITLLGNKDLESEDLLAVELGYKFNYCKLVTFEAAGFFNSYRDLAGLDPSSMENDFVLDTVPYIHSKFATGNVGTAETKGFEVSLNLQTADWLRFFAGYTYLDVELKSDEASLEGAGQSVVLINASPVHQLNCRAYCDLPKGFEFDICAYLAGEMEEVDVKAYQRLDARFGWRSRSLDISLAFQNILEDQHVEFWDSWYGAANQVESSVYGKVTWWL